MKNVKIPWKNGCFLPLSRHEWQVMGLKKVLYSYLVPEMVLEKFHEKWMLGSAKTKLPPLSLTTSVKVAKPLCRSGIECSLSETCCWALPPPAAHHHPPQLRLTSAQWHRLLCFFPDQWSSPYGYCAEIVLTKNFLPNLTYFLSTLPRKTTPEIFSLRRAFLLQPPKGQCQNFDLKTNVI